MSADGVPPRITVVTLGVADVEAAATFYEGLGWARSAASVAGEIAFFDLNGVVLGLFGYAALAEDARLPAGEPPPFRGTTVAVNVASEAEVDAALAAAVAAGATLLKPGTRADWGGYSGYWADPDGNAWEVAHVPGFGLGADGRLVLTPG